MDLQHVDIRPCSVGTCSNTSRYECPRCFVRYCTVKCYQQHSTTCVRAFASDGQDGLRGVKVSDVDWKSSNKTLLKVLREHGIGMPDELDDIDKNEYNYNLELDDDDEEEESSFCGNESTDEDNTNNENMESVTDMLERLGDDLEANTVSYEEGIKRLPAELLADFEAMVKDGRISKILPVWTPWWVVQSEEETVLPDLPTKSDLTCTVSFARRKASPLISHTIVVVICVYVYLQRNYNGDISTAEAANDAADVLEKHIPYKPNEDLRAAVEPWNYQYFLQDAAAIYSGRRDWVTRALSDTVKILRLSTGTARKTRTSSTWRDNWRAL